MYSQLVKNRIAYQKLCKSRYNKHEQWLLLGGGIREDNNFVIDTFPIHLVSVISRE